MVDPKLSPVQALMLAGDLDREPARALLQALMGAGWFLVKIERSPAADGGPSREMGLPPVRRWVMWDADDA